MEQSFWYKRIPSLTCYVYASLAVQISTLHTFLSSKFQNLKVSSHKWHTPSSAIPCLTLILNNNEQKRECTVKFVKNTPSSLSESYKLWTATHDLLNLSYELVSLISSTQTDRGVEIEIYYDRNFLQEVGDLPPLVPNPLQLQLLLIQLTLNPRKFYSNNVDLASTAAVLWFISTTDCIVLVTRGLEALRLIVLARWVVQCGNSTKKLKSNEIHNGIRRSRKEEK